MMLFALVLCLLNLSHGILSAEREEQYIALSKKYKVVSRDGISYVPVLLNQLTMLRQLPSELRSSILSKLEQKDVLCITAVNKAFYTASIVHLYSNIHYQAFSKCFLDGKRIQLHGLVTGINEYLFSNYDELSIRRLCDFLKGQETIKLDCPSVDPNAGKGFAPGIPRTPLKYQIANCEITKDEYSAAKEKSIETFLYIVDNLKHNSGLASFTCAGAETGASVAVTAPIVKSMQGGLSTIKKLCLSGLCIEEEAGKSFIHFVHNHPVLENLNLENCKLAEKDIESFLYLLRFNTKLKKLDLCCITFGEGAIKRLAFALYGNTTLTTLNIGSADLYSKDIIVLSKAICKNTSLTDLDLSANTMDGDTTPLQSILHSTIIKKLSLYDAIEAGCCDEIVDVLCKNSTLTQLDFGDICIDESLAQKLRYFMDTNGALKRLDLKNMWCRDGTNRDEIKKCLTSSTTKIVDLSFDLSFCG